MTHPFLSRRSTPVFYAVLHGCEESLALLLEAQADPSLRPWDRVRSRLLAACRGIAC